MTSAPSRTPIRPQSPSPNRPPSGGGAGGTGVTLDPVRLLKQYYPYLMLAFIIGSGMGVGAFFVLRKTYPIFESSILYQCKGQVMKIGELSTTGDNEDEMTRFMGTQVQMLKSDQVLEAAAKDPEVRKTRWARQFERDGKYQPTDASISLSEDIAARILPQTELIRLTVKVHDPNDALTIVTAVNDAYLDDLSRDARNQTSERRRSLSGLLRKNESRRLQLSREKERLMDENNVDDLDVASGQAGLEVVRINIELVETRGDLASGRATMERFQKSIDTGTFDPGDDLREVARQDPIIRQFASQVANLKAEVSRLKTQGYQEQHPTIQELQAGITAVEHERDQKFQELLRNLFDSQVESTRSMIKSLESKESDLNERFLDATRRREDLVRIVEQIDDLTKEINRLSEEEQKNREQLDNIEAISSSTDANRVRLIRAGQLPDRPTFPQLKMMVPLGAIFATGLVAGLVVLRELLDQRVKGPADIGMIPRLPVLGVIPIASQDPSKPATVETAFRDTPTGVITESIRHLRAPLLKKMQQQDAKTLLVLGGMPNSGTTSVVTNLALSCAAGRERVLIVDANLRRPNVHNVFGLNAGPGLGDVLADEVNVDEAIQETTTDNLFIISAGTPEHRSLPEHLATRSMDEVLDYAKAHFDRVLVDAPPAIVSGDGIVLANKCDASLMVVRALGEKRGLVARLRNQLADTSSELLGLVINAVQPSAGGYFKDNIKKTHEYRDENA